MGSPRSEPAAAAANRNTTAGSRLSEGGTILDVTRDGRFIMLRRGTTSSNLRVVVHWTEELKQILAAGGVR